MGLSKTTYEKRRELGLCIQCGESVVDNKSTCPGCTEKANECRRRRSEKRKASGCCVNCKEPAMPGCATCKDCSKKSSQACLTRYYKRKEIGQCRDCGLPAINEGDSRCPTCAEKFRVYQSERVDRKRQAGICLFCPLLTRSGRKTCLKCALAISTRQQEARRKLKQEVFGAYGGVKCSKCGFDADLDVLQIDHINGGGTKHLKEIGRARLYNWLKKNNFPPGYRVLCSNCNFSDGLKRVRANLLVDERKDESDANQQGTLRGTQSQESLCTM